MNNMKFSYMKFEFTLYNSRKSNFSQCLMAIIEKIPTKRTLFCSMAYVSE